MPDCDALNDVQPCGCAFKKTNSGKVVNRHDLGGWGWLMSYIVLDLSLKVVKRLNLAGPCGADCTISGAGGLRMWCAAPTAFDPK